MFLIDDYSPRHTVEMRDELIVPYLITRFYTAGENKTIHDPDFMQTFKRAYLHVNVKGVSEPYMRHPLGDVYKEQDNLIILETNITGKTTNGSKRHCHNCKTTSTPYWRRSKLYDKLDCCNACGLYERHHLESRPIYLKPNGERLKIRKDCLLGYTK
ncbi:hypothetical protein E3Q09_02950 [Wallemia mellicola]|uniref:GATA-type domain-containing protein n=1 Tax=Wallemia mellicola TaxID=1708541 RepID=A0AB74KBX7_9BASI|nr:hypothetical protein E3Q12_02664 [Wallemia mellicola]TIC34425.1 hypothetical protein E3Q09_02950 [Wallemia mellicola]TIC54220.1 hypothetical protein E3Q04_02807 [Wallemia mellicola]TIC60850.1 hypothetical protein E3Q03_02991 [Wallemia mellicola]